MKLEDKFTYPLIWIPFLGLIATIYWITVGHWIVAVVLFFVSLVLTRTLIWNALHHGLDGIGYFKCRNGVSTLYKDSSLGDIIANTTGKVLAEVVIIRDQEELVCLMDNMEALRCFSKRTKIRLVKVGEVYGKALYFARI